MPNLLPPQADAVREAGRDAGLAVEFYDGVACGVAPGVPFLDQLARLAGFELLALADGLVGAEERVVESGGEGVEGWEALGVCEELVAEEGEGLFHVRGEEGFAGREWSGCCSLESGGGSGGVRKLPLGVLRCRLEV